MSDAKTPNPVLWFIALYLGGITVLTILAGVLKALIGLL